MMKLRSLALVATLIGCTTAGGADDGTTDAGACVHVGDPCSADGDASSGLVCIDGPAGFACERFHDDGGAPWCRLQGDPCVEETQCCGIACVSGTCQVASSDGGPGACGGPGAPCTEEGVTTHRAGSVPLMCVRSGAGLQCERVDPDGGVLCRAGGDTCDVGRTDQCCNVLCFSGLGSSGVCAEGRDGGP